MGVPKYPSIFAKNYRMLCTVRACCEGTGTDCTLARCLNVRSKRTNVPYHEVLYVT